MMLFLFPSYWTIPYVSIEDRRLVYLYNLAFLGVVGSLVTNLFLHLTYLESDRLQGITQARLKTPESWSGRVGVGDGGGGGDGEDSSLCVDHSCVSWDAEEVGYSYTSDSLFVATRIKDSVEQSICPEEQPGQAGAHTPSCAQYRRIYKQNYYPVNIHSFLLLINAHAEAPEFCSERAADQDCPYEYSLRSLPGKLVSTNGSVLARFKGEEDQLRDLTVQSFLEAAGVRSLSEGEDTLRWSYSAASQARYQVSISERRAESFSSISSSTWTTPDWDTSLDY